MKKLKITYYLFIMSIVSIILLFAVEINPYQKEDKLYNLKITAASDMKKSMQVIYDLRLANGIAFDVLNDPNQTGLIGSEYTEITTTLGPIEVKRTSTNPDFAALMVQLFDDIGLKSGDLIAVGTSGSFPALSIAVQCAAKVMGIHVLSILSIGSSTFGATDVELTVADIENELVNAGYFPNPSIGASIGGEDDKLISPMFPGAPLIAEDAILRNNLNLIKGNLFKDSVLNRVKLYKKAAADREISAFINIGGAEVNLGNGDAGYRISAGHVTKIPEYKEGSAGVIKYMYENGAAVINLLNIKEICLKYRIPFDPIPLPLPGSTEIYYMRTSILYYFIIMSVYLFIMSVIIIVINRESNNKY